MRNFRTIWESLGFRDNPYSAEPLEPTEKDFGLFVGREAESRRFATTISNKAGCISVVEGDVGVGKTSSYPSAVSISLEHAMGTLRGLAEKRIAALYLTRTEEKILGKMAEVGEFRPKEYALFGLKSAQALNKYLSKFVEAELLSRTKEEAASLYRTRGDVNLLFPDPYKPEIQRKSL